MDTRIINTKSELLFFDYMRKELEIPEDMIAIGYRLNSRTEVDFAVIDRITNLPIMIFEIKGVKNQRSIDSARKFIRNIGAHYGKISARVYMAFLMDDNSFDIEEVNPINGATINKEVKPLDLNYRLNRNSVVSETAKKKEEEKERVIDSLSIVSWILATLIAIGYVVLKVVDYSITTIDIAILGAIIGLVLLPFANKIRFLGVEYERYVKAKNNRELP